MDICTLWELRCCVLVYKTWCLHGSAPLYLADEIKYMADFEVHRFDLLPHVVHCCPPSAIGPSLLLLSVLGTICPTYRVRTLSVSDVVCTFSSSGVPFYDFHHNFSSAFTVTVVIFILLLIYLLKKLTGNQHCNRVEVITMMTMTVMYMRHRLQARGICPNYRYVTVKRRSDLWRRTPEMPRFYVARRRRTASVTVTACPVCRRRWPLTYARNTSIPAALTGVSQKLTVISEST